MYATDSQFATVETERVSDPPSYIESLRNIVDTLGYGKEVVPGNHYAEPPEEVLHEVRRQVKNDIVAGRVKTEDGSRSSPSEDTKTKIGVCEVEADVDGDGFEYSVSYDSRRFNWEEDVAVETDENLCRIRASTPRLPPIYLCLTSVRHPRVMTASGTSTSPKEGFKLSNPCSVRLLPRHFSL